MKKVIHYCWFGNGEKNKLINDCIKYWKKFFPDWEIKEWNEKNFDINSNIFVKQAYERKKYAFVSDYVRMLALYNEGGLYFDTDVEVKKNFENLLKEKKMVLSYELSNTVMTGMIFTEKNNECIKRMLDYYENKNFIKENGTEDITPNTEILSNIIKDMNIELNGKFIEKDGIVIYPYDYFCAFDMENSCYNITANTITIHHYDGSWQNKRIYLFSKIRRKIFSFFGRDKIQMMRDIYKKIIKNKDKRV